MNPVDMVISYMTCFGLGMMAGATCVVVYGLHRFKQAAKAQQAALKQLEKKMVDAAEQMNTIKSRLGRVQEITKLQLDLLAALRQPSKNASHSKYKNGLGAEVKSLEEEKIALLKSILQDGYDPVIKVMTEDGESKAIKLSEYMGNAGITAEQLPPPVPIDASRKPVGRKAGKLTVYSGGKANDKPKDS